MRFNVSTSQFRKSVVFIIYTIFATFVILELTLRIIPPISTGNGGGIGKAWKAQYWQPINKQGYRDFEVELNPNKKLIVSVGDSFAAGHGVLFEETYSYALKQRFVETHNVVNLGDSGTSTSQQQQNYKRFVDNFKRPPDVVLYQYFGNDIEDFANTQKCRHPRGIILRIISKVSYSYGLLDSMLLQRHFSSCYMNALFETYQNESSFTKHKNQIQKFIGLMQSQKAQVIFIVFPFLANDKLLLESDSLYVKKLQSHFKKFCSKGDFFYDGSVSSLKLRAKDRVANFMDAHPSAMLHNAIAHDLEKLILDQGDAYSVKGLHSCK